MPLNFSSCNDNVEKKVSLVGVDIDRFGIDFDHFKLVSGKMQQTESTLSYKMHLPTANYPDFAQNAMIAGYHPWKKGGVNYGHIQIGGGLNDQIYYTIKRIRGHRLILGYDKIEEILYVVDFKTGW